MTPAERKRAQDALLQAQAARTLQGLALAAGLPGYWLGGWLGVAAAFLAFLVLGLARPPRPDL